MSILHDCSSLASPCLGYGGPKPSEIWFSPWFLDTCKVIYGIDGAGESTKLVVGLSYIDLPKATWQRDGLKITKTMKETERKTIWILTDTYDDQMHRLGIWPD